VLATDKKIGVDLATFAATTRHLLRNLKDLVVPYHKCTAHVNAWVSDGSPSSK
jgi:hypothetical protein